MKSHPLIDAKEPENKCVVPRVVAFQESSVTELSKLVTCGGGHGPICRPLGHGKWLSNSPQQGSAAALRSSLLLAIVARLIRIARCEIYRAILRSL